MRARSSDPLTAATTSILLPAIRSHGFRRQSNRMIARIENDILQFLYVQLTGSGHGDFCITYAANSLFCPRDYHILQPGERLKRPDGADAWMPAGTHEAADASMVEVLTLFHAQALPFFERTKSPDGLRERLIGDLQELDHHAHLEIACCEAKCKRFQEARSHARRAIELYRQDGRSWCPQYIDVAEQLIAGIEKDGAVELLRGWTLYSSKKLRLKI